MQCECGVWMICIEDFAGNERQCGHWADWCPACKKVFFGGFWDDFPPMASGSEPSEDEVYRYIG